MSREIDFAGTMVAGIDAIASTIGSLVCERCGPAHGSVYIALRTDPANAVVGTFTPAQARLMAMDMLVAADEIDGGATRQ